MSEVKNAKFIDYFHKIKLGLVKPSILKKDHHLSIFEKKILESMLYHKKGKYSFAINQLINFKSNVNFLEAFRCSCIGKCYNDSTNYAEAMKYLKQSVEYFQKCNDTDYIFVPLFDLLVLHMNLKDIDNFNVFYTIFKTLPLNTQVKRFKSCQAEIFYTLLNENPNEALRKIDYINKNFSNEIEDRLGYFYILKIMALVKLSKYKTCFEILEKYSLSSGYRVRSNYKYIMSLLNFLVYKKSIYVYQRDFLEATQLYNELLVIKNLSESNVKEAKDKWKELQSNNEKLYGNDFKFGGDDCLFFRVLQTVQSTTNFIIQDSIDKKEIKSASEKLYFMLVSYATPVPKEHLISILWKEELDEKNDKRLRSLIYIIKKNYGINILAKDGKYSIISSEVKVA